MPISNTNSASNLLLSSTSEENGIVEQHQIIIKEAVVTDPMTDTTMSPLNTETTKCTPEIRIENSSQVNKEIKSTETDVTNKEAENYNNEKTEIEASNETINTEKEKSLFSVVSIFRLLAKALKAAPFALDRKIN